jgi:uncharacterized protein
MSAFFIETSKTDLELKDSPIEPSWVIEGNPVAQNALLSKSADRMAWTYVWQCTGGTFNWYYDCDETAYLLEGSIVLESEKMGPKRYGPGDVVFFKRGAHARWHVEGHVRKLAFCRHTLPVYIALPLRALARLNRFFAFRAANKRSALNPG